MLVTVKPIDLVSDNPITKWHGKTGQENFGQGIKLEVLVGDDHKYATGLDEETRKELEEALGVDLSNNYRPGTPHPFWSTPQAVIKLPNHTKHFHTERPLDKLKVLNMKASIFVANSIADLKSGNYPDATHVIVEEQQEAVVKARRTDQLAKSYELLSRMDRKQKINVIWLVLEISAYKQSDEFIQARVGEAIADHTEKFLNIAQMDAKVISNHALVLEATYQAILTKEAGGYFYLGNPLGLDLGDAAKNLQKIENQQLKAIIIQKLQSNS